MSPPYIISGRNMPRGATPMRVGPRSSFPIAPVTQVNFEFSTVYPFFSPVSRQVNFVIQNNGFTRRNTDGDGVPAYANNPVPPQPQWHEITGVLHADFEASWIANVGGTIGLTGFGIGAPAPITDTWFRTNGADIRGQITRTVTGAGQLFSNVSRYQIRDFITKEIKADFTVGLQFST